MQQTLSGSIHAVRRHVKILKQRQELWNQEVDILAQIAQKVSIEKEILVHENAELRFALIEERNRRERGKKTDILGRDEPGQAAFVSPNKIAAFRIRKEEKEAQKRIIEQKKEQARATKALEKEKQAQEARERREKGRRRWRKRKCGWNRLEKGGFSRKRQIRRLGGSKRRQWLESRCASLLQSVCR